MRRSSAACWRGWRRPPRAAATGIRTAIDLVRSSEPVPARRDRLVGLRHRRAVGVLSRVRRVAPNGVIVMSYFIGMLGNTLPLPGGIGGVDGGMIGAFTAFGVAVQVSVVSVLAYRAFAFWLPTLPGAIAYLQLRRTVSRWQQEPAADAERSAQQRSAALMDASHLAILYEVTDPASRT